MSIRRLFKPLFFTYRGYPLPSERHSNGSSTRCWIARKFRLVFAVNNILMSPKQQFDCVAKKKYVCRPLKLEWSGAWLAQTGRMEEIYNCFIILTPSTYTQTHTAGQRGESHTFMVNARQSDFIIRICESHGKFEVSGENWLAQQLISLPIGLSESDIKVNRNHRVRRRRRQKAWQIVLGSRTRALSLLCLCRCFVFTIHILFHFSKSILSSWMTGCRELCLRLIHRPLF